MSEKIEVFVSNDHEWASYKTKFNKKYTTEEEALK